MGMDSVGFRQENGCGARLGNTEVRQFNPGSGNPQRQLPGQPGPDGPRAGAVGHRDLVVDDLAADPEPGGMAVLDPGPLELLGLEEGTGDGPWRGQADPEVRPPSDPSAGIASGLSRSLMTIPAAGLRPPSTASADPACSGRVASFLGS